MPITITQGTSRMTKKSLEGKNYEQEDSETNFIAGDDVSALGAGLCDNVSLDGEGKKKSLQVKGFLKPAPGQKVKGNEAGSTFLILARMEKKGGAPQLVYLDATGIGGGYPPDDVSLALIKVSGTDKIEIKGFATPDNEQLANFATNVGVSPDDGSVSEDKLFLVRDASTDPPTLKFVNFCGGLKGFVTPPEAQLADYETNVGVTPGAGSSTSDNLLFLARDASGETPVLKFVNFCGGLRGFNEASTEVKRLTLRPFITPDITTAGTILDNILFPVWDNSGGELRLSYTTLDAPKITGGTYAFVTTTNQGKDISIEGVHYISGDNTNVVFTTDPNDPKTIKVDVYYK